jgi:hypothetical protein
LDAMSAVKRLGVLAARESRLGERRTSRQERQCQQFRFHVVPSFLPCIGACRWPKPKYIRIRGRGWYRISRLVARRTGGGGIEPTRPTSASSRLQIAIQLWQNRMYEEDLQRR